MNLLPFATYTNPNYQPAGHHKAIADALEAVERGDCDRLMIFMPPRHGKSELASRRFPAWYLGRNSDKQIIAASYNSELATDFGREVRNIVASPEYQRIFNIALAEDSQAANRWHTSKGGMYVAAGVGTAITGRGADVLLIDDPFKDREEADSETTRDRVWNWYTSTAYTRLMPRGAVVLIQTRWHDDDLAGRLLNSKDKWELIELPAIRDNKPLWPEWYNLEALRRIELAIGPRDWNALYQQQPIPDDGEYFKKDWFKFYDKFPKDLRIYGASDYAVTDDGGDFTEHGIFGIDHKDDIYILDWWSGQTTPDVWVEMQCDLIKQYKPIIWLGESGPIRRAIEPFLTKRMNERRDYCRLEWLTSTTDKATRARAFQARCSMGKVYLPNKEFAHSLLKQLLRFPAGKYDDKVDVCSLFGRALDQVYSPRQEAPIKYPNLGIV